MTATLSQFLISCRRPFRPSSWSGPRARPPVRRKAGENLDALESRHTRLDRNHVEVLLPVVRQPDELGPAGEARLRGGDLLGFQVLLQTIGDGLAVLALQRLERDRDCLVALLAQDLDICAHAGAVSLGELVERDLDLEDLDLLD